MAERLSNPSVSATQPLTGADAFHQLIEDLNTILGPSSGIDSADVDPEDLEFLMSKYISNSTEWRRYAWSDSSRHYTKNLVDKGNGKSNLLVVVWTPGKGSPIHDHANAQSIMKVLKGSLKETLYTWPDSSFLKDGKPSPPTIKKETVYTENQVTYMSDQLGLHRISNADPDETAVSLHLYTPPHAATFGCHVFDEQTGKASRVKQNNFFSELGYKV